MTEISSAVDRPASEWAQILGLPCYLRTTQEGRLKFPSLLSPRRRLTSFDDPLKGSSISTNDKSAAKRALVSLALDFVVIASSRTSNSLAAQTGEGGFCFPRQQCPGGPARKRFEQLPRLGRADLFQDF